MGLFKAFATGYSKGLQKNEISSSTNSIIAPSTLLLEEDERIITEISASLLEERAVGQWVSGGARLRVSKRVSIGASQGHYESHGELKKIDSGLLTITNNRVIFRGTLRTLELKKKDLLSVEPQDKIISLSKKGKQKRVCFSVENSALAFIAITDAKKFNEAKDTGLTSFSNNLVAFYEVHGSVGKPDIIGELFSHAQEVGLDLRRLQESKQIGRIEVSVNKANDTTTGEITIPILNPALSANTLKDWVESVKKVFRYEAQIKIK